MTEERAFWLAWAQVSGVGPVLLQRLQQHFGTLTAAWQASSAALQAVEGMGTQTLEQVNAARSQLHPAEFLVSHAAQNPHFWTPADSHEYPRLLLEIASPPPVLYYRGIVDEGENQGGKALIGIVGTRSPSEYGKRWTRKISMALARNGFTVVSGLAEGIDTEAHQGCLDAGGRTIAVLGTGVDIVYPPRNRKLYEQIVEQGLVVSEFPSKTPPDRAHFPRRNRIIAGLCRAVLVMEAPTKSGALITARFTNDFGRDVYVLPGSLDNPRSHGCLGLLNKGATVILSEGHLLELLGSMPQIDSVPAAFEQLSLPNLEPELQQVLTTIASELMSFDAIVQQTGYATGIVASALLQLELLGLVSQLPGMRYQRC
ncbi:DNA-processing protein DprA [Chroococcidiopsis thermalis]|uniref:DNA protecting protein DprA n=1 Tax=Chroococcidiopsis thermalis (strain PCC 7203) TaxID=251229 RepID=K9TSQ7_CHRTP|nr:DNA-processing protein DprA [Chroococcidiopsis thermalis]AFY85585.1 DNA protecting protein DprA [Chroococcidiopsis thermalis PCC 7203]